MLLNGNNYKWYNACVANEVTVMNHYLGKATVNTVGRVVVTSPRTGGKLSN